MDVRSTTAVEELTNEAFSVFVRDGLLILPSRSTATIVDASGKLVFEGQPTTGNNAVDIQSLPAGIYNVQQGGGYARFLK